MYDLSHFKENEGRGVIEFMKRHPFAMLMGCSGLEPVATQVPILFEQRGEKLFLLGHMMRKQDHQLAFENLQQSYRAKLTKSIIAFEIEVESIDNVFKLSQNRDKESYDRIVEKLRQGDHEAQMIANEMAKRRDRLFDEPTK